MDDEEVKEWFMIQDERWQLNYDEVMRFVKTNGKN